MTIKNVVLSSLSLLIFGSATAQFKAEYGNNILAVSPLQVSNPGVGFGISYERDLDKKGIVSLYLPLAISFANTDNYNNYYYSYPYPSVKYTTGFFMPGLKFYPTGSKGKVKYAVGPNLAIVAGQRPVATPVILIYPGPTEIYSMKNRFSLGTMVFNSLNINPTPHLNIGLEMGMGVSYIDMTDGVNTGMMPFLFQLNAKIGYRF